MGNSIIKIIEQYKDFMLNFMIRLFKICFFDGSSKGVFSHVPSDIKKFYYLQ